MLRLWYVSMILRQLVREFREENIALASLAQRLLNDSQVLVRVKGSLGSPLTRPARLAPCRLPLGQANGRSDAHSRVD